MFNCRFGLVNLRTVEPFGAENVASRRPGIGFVQMVGFGLLFKIAQAGAVLGDGLNGRRFCYTLSFGE